MRKLTWALLPLLLLSLLSFGLFSPMTTQAIEEITPTPAPEGERESAPETFDADALLDGALEDLSEGNLRSAISKLDELLAVEIDNVQGYLLRGVAYARLGRFDQAEADLTTAIDLEPWNWELLIVRGDIYSQMNDTTGALLDYEQSIAIYPFNQNAFARRADLYFQLGDTEAGNVDDRIAQALSASSFGDTQSADELLQVAIDEGGDLESVAHAYLIRGLFLLGESEYADAIIAYDNAQDINPDLHMIYLGRGIAYRESGDVERAGQDFFQRITLLGDDFRDEEAAIGDTLDLEMAYRRVYRISFEGEAGDVVTLTARDTGETVVDPLIALVGPDDEPIAGDDDFGGGLDSQIEDFELPADGTYTLLLGHAEGGYDFGFQGIVEVTIE
jgi:tetratricopeptide (TPR) repeat protein